jgi:hypothetical protein
MKMFKRKNTTIENKVQEPVEPASPQELLEQGYSVVSAGVGPWVGNGPDGEARVIRELVFRKPEDTSGEAVIQTTYKQRMLGGMSVRSAIQESRLLTPDLESHAEQWQITYGQEQNLSEAIASQPNENS